MGAQVPSQGKVWATADVQGETGMAALLKSVSMTYWYTPSKTRIDVSVMHGAFSFVLICDETTGKALMLANAPSNKKIASWLDWKDYQKHNLADRIKYETSAEDTKNVAGQVCRKVEAVAESGEKMSYFICDSPGAATTKLMERFLGKLGGLPLAFSYDMGANMALRFSAKEVSSSPPPADLFKLSIPEGYKKVPMKDFAKEIGNIPGF